MLAEQSFRRTLFFALLLGHFHKRILEDGVRQKLILPESWMSGHNT